MAGETYIINTVQDMLRVPLERRDEMLRQVAYALALHELAFGDEAAAVPITELTWTDDGDISVDLSANGEPLLKLQVTEG